MARRLSVAKRLQYRIEYIVVRSLIAGCAAVPLPWLRRVGGGLGWIAYHVVRIRRGIVMRNIGACLPDTDRRMASRIARESYKNFGRSLMELSVFKRLSADDLSAMVTMEGLENLDDALARGNGAILFTGHFGNWELLGAAVAAKGYPLHVTDTDHSNKLVHKILTDLRTARGMKVIAPQRPVSHLLRLLSENQIIAYLADQDAGRSGISVEFFGRPASTIRGPAVFAIRKGCPIVPCFMIRQKKGRHLGTFGKPIWPNPELTGNAALVDLTQRYTRLLEGFVRKHPEMYFWVHRRWKTRPVAPAA